MCDTSQAGAYYCRRRIAIGGGLQYMTDWRGKEVVCVMVALRDNEERYAFSGRGDSY